jgi:site-specific DNA-cytosine methylase
MSDLLLTEALRLKSDLERQRQAPSAADLEAEAKRMLAEQNAQAVRQAAQKVGDVEPDQAARAQALAAQTGLPAGVVERNVNEVERRVRMQAFDRVAEDPAMAAFYSDPSNLAVASDDIDVLRSVADVVRSLPAGAMKGAGAGLKGLGEQIDAGARMIDRGVRGVLGNRVADAFWFDYGPNPATLLIDAGRAAKGAGAEIAAPVERQNMATDVGEGIGQLGAQIFAMLVSRGMLGLPMLLGQGADQQAEKQEKVGAKGTVEGDAAIFAGAAVTALTERFGLDILMRKVPESVRSSILKKLADVSVRFGAEYAQEVVEGILQNVVEYAFYNPNAEIFEDFTYEATVAGTSAAIVRSIILTASGGKAAARARQASEKAEKQAEQLKTINQLAEQSKLRERSPDKFRAFVTGLMKPDQAVEIDAQTAVTLFQEQPDLAQFMSPEEVERLARDVAVAQETGADVRMPLSTFVNAFVGTPAFDTLAENVRLSDDGVTAREAAEWTPEQVEEQLGRMRDELGDVVSKQDQIRTIYDDIFGQLKAAALDDVAATQYAALVTARVRTRADRLGLDPVDVYLENRPLVRRQLTGGKIDQLDLTLDDLRSPAKITSRRAFGSSLLEFLSQRGGLIDAGGELKGMDADKWHRGQKGRRRLVVETRNAAAGEKLTPGTVDATEASKLSLDEAARAAWEEGYFPELPDRATPEDLLSAIEAELRGNPVYSPRNRNEALAQRLDAMGQLDEVLNTLGLDVKAVTGEQVREAMDRYAAGQDVNADGERTLEQGDNLPAGEGSGQTATQAGGGQAPAAQAAQDGQPKVSLGAERTATVEKAAALDGEATRISKSKAWATGRDLKLAFQESVQNAAKAAGVDLTSDSPETIAFLTRMAVRDAIEAFKTNANAVGWYDLKTRQALAVMSLVHPEIATDELARFRFTWALAVTSNGLKVDKNFELAEQVYRRMKGNSVAPGEMPTDIEAGNAQAAINNSLGLFNRLQKLWGIDNLRRFMLTDFTVSEITAIDKDLSPTGEFSTETVRGAAIIGPKIGNGFFSNLYGFFDALTMDRWLVRSWGRWTGTLIQVDQEAASRGRTRLRAALGGLDVEAFARELRRITRKGAKGQDLEVNRADRERMIAALEARAGAGAEVVTDADLDQVALAVGKGSATPQFRAIMDRVGDDGGAAASAWVAAYEEGLAKFSGETKSEGLATKYANDAVPAPDSSYGKGLRNAANNLAKQLDGQKEQPAGPAERQKIRAVFRLALAELQKRPEFASLNMSDLQALLWYAEKRLYETAKEDVVLAEKPDEAGKGSAKTKVEPVDIGGYDDDEAPDYANAAAAVARAQGVSERRIKAALTKEEKNGRAAAARPGDGGLQAGAGQPPAARGFAGSEKRRFVGDAATRRVRSDRGRNAEPSGSYQGRGRKDGRGVRLLKPADLGVTAVERWEAGRYLKQVFNRNGVETPAFFELAPGDEKNAQAFAAAITAAKERMGAVGAAVFVYDPADYAGMRLFLSENGQAGVAIKPDGDIVSVFGGGGTGRAVMELAVAAGGRKLDAFETILPEFYAAHGFRAVARLTWDDSQAPAGWDKAAFAKFNNGEPDVVFMVYDPAHTGRHSLRDGVRLKGEGSYDRAVRAQAREMKAIANRAGEGRTLEQPARPRIATWFSGARTLEAAIGAVDSTMAVEYDAEINEFANTAFGTAFVTRGVGDVDPQEIADADVTLFHASPVCKNFSAAKTLRGANELDRASAQAVARAITVAKPPVVTIENVPQYAETALFKEITDALNAAGYTWDIVIHDAADYGAAQTRKRMLLRAVRDGELPPLPEKVGPSDWYEALSDLIEDAPDGTIPPVERQRLDDMIAKGRLDAGQPIITMGGSGFRGSWSAANAGGAAPTLKAANEKPRIILPDGRVKVVTPRMMARLMGLPDTYPVPDSATLAKTVLGNGIEGNVTRSLIAPLLETAGEGRTLEQPARQDRGPLATVEAQLADLADDIDGIRDGEFDPAAARKVLDKLSEGERADYRARMLDRALLWLDGQIDADQDAVAEEILAVLNRSQQVAEMRGRMAAAVERGDTLEQGDARAPGATLQVPADMVGNRTYDDPKAFEELQQNIADFIGAKIDARGKKYIRSNRHDGFVVSEDGFSSVYLKTPDNLLLRVSNHRPKNKLSGAFSDIYVTIDNLWATIELGKEKTFVPVNFQDEWDEYVDPTFGDRLGAALSDVIAKARAAKKQDFNQREGSMPRGSIRLLPGGRSIITLTEKADLSTFLHELSHGWLEELRADAQRPDAPAEIVADWERTAAYLGIAPDVAEIPVEAHETWARTGEAYFREGKAPAQDLASVFQRFKAWLTRIYKTLTELRVPINDEIRGVFDRLIASDEEIAAARREYGLDALFSTAQAAGMTEAEFRAYADLAARARLEAETEVAEALQRDAEREQTEQYREAREAIANEVEAQVRAEPVHQAIAFLTAGRLPDGSTVDAPVKLARGLLKDAYGARVTKRLPRGVTADEGVPADMVASMFGFTSGDELVQAMLAAPPIEQEIERRTQAQLRAQFPDARTDGRAYEASIAALHGDGQMRVLEAEFRALKRLGAGQMVDAAVRRTLAGQKAPSAADVTDADVTQQESEAVRMSPGAGPQGRADAALGRARVQATAKAAKDMRGDQAAARRIAVDALSVDREAIERAVDQLNATTQVREIMDTQRWRRAEKAAAKAVVDAVAGREWAAAAWHQRQRIIAAHMVRRSTEARKEIETAIERFRKYLSKKPGAIDWDYLQRARAILEAYQFGSEMSDRRRAVLELRQIERWKAALAEDEQARLEIAPEILAADGTTHYRDLTLEEFIALRDTVENIVAVGRTKTRLLRNKAERDLNRTAALVAETILDNLKVKARRSRDAIEKGVGYGLERFKNQFFASHRKIENLVREMDGFAPLGPVWQALFKPLQDAQNDETRMSIEATAKIKELFERFPEDGRRTWRTRTTYHPEIGQPLSKATVISLALNWGNEGNREAIRKGFKWSDAQVDAVFARSMTEADWQFVQSVWDYIDTFWPALAALEKKVKGVVPVKVDAAAVATPFGEFKGGYYPLKYDPDMSERAYSHQVDKLAQQLMSGAVAKASTRTGAAIERVGSGGMPVRLELDVLFEHVAELIHDISHREAILDVARLLDHPEVRGAILDVKGPQFHRVMKEWVRDIAAGDVPALSPFDKVVQHLRSGMSISAMGWKLTTAMVQPTGFFSSAAALPKGVLAKHVASFYGAPQGMKQKVAFVYERSVEMRTRAKSLDRDIRDTLRQLGPEGKIDAVKRSFFYLTGMMDMGVAVPTWLAAYEVGMEQFDGDEAKAIDYADQTVRTTQSSGLQKDLAQIQRGDPRMKMFTAFYSFFSASYNMMVDQARGVRRPADMPKFVANMALLTFLPAIASELMMGRGPEDDEEPEGWAKWMAATTLKYALSGFVGVRDVVNALGSNFGYAGSPVGSAVESLVRLGKQIGQGEADRGLVKAAVDTAGPVLHLPSRQAWITAEGIYLWAEGADITPFEMFVTRDPDKFR